MAISTKAARDLLKSTGDILRDSAADLLASSDFISRTIGMNNSYEDIMLLVQALGRQPVSLLGKDYLFIFDHVRRNYQQGTTISSTMYGGGNYWCPKFTFYKEKPTVRFADPYNDPLNLLDRWMPNFTTNVTKSENINKFYAESNDGAVNNKTINSAASNMGTATGQYSTSFQDLGTCDLIKKTNDNFRNGKYNTLVARFHTNSMDSRDPENPTQTAISQGYGMSHGRNLLKMVPDEPNGYNNPYCRVWTYHHQYHRIVDAIRPFADGDGSTVNSAEELEQLEFSGDYRNVGFRTLESKNYDIKGGSVRLDKHGVLNYENGFVNIAPTAKIKDYFEGKEDDKDRKSVSLKRCMFSIENLAWRDEKKENQTEFDAYGLSAEQRGPLGGRIMWFPPYDINFSEDVSVKWNSNEFIGRGENIYTYTNTERRGNLSFTLLIDHPSVLDYWTGHERNGMKNKGQTLLPGNTDGVDGKDNQENTLLRFFAGCDILTAKPQGYWMKEAKPDNSADPAKEDVVNPNPQKADEVKPPAKHTLCCILYYPNNYSGVDDRPFGNNPKVNAIHYLMNGIGAQKYVDDNKDAVDIPTSISSKPGGDGEGHGGYEIGGNISITTQALQTSASVRRKTYSDVTTPVKKAQYLTSSSGTPPLKATYDGIEYTLAKIIGSEALSYSEVNEKLWFRKRWYYRVDKAFENDKLSKDISYVDTKCFDLNGNGYEKVRQSSSISSKFGIPNNDDNFHLISFASLFNALEGSDNKVITSSPDVNESDVKIVQEILNYKENGIKIKSIKFRGHASKAGYGSSNAMLADNRGKTFKAWMMGKGFPKPEGGEAELADHIREGGSRNDVDNGDANSLTAKLWRSASVFIEYEKSAVVDAAETDSEVETTTDPETGEQKVVTNTNTDPDAGSTVEYPLSRTEVYKGGRGTVDARYKRFIETPEGKDWLEEQKKKYPNMGTTQLMNLFGDTFEKDPNQGEDEEPKKIDTVTRESVVKRYDNEGEFFELLDKESPFLHHLITDKIKYFDPAFHSISPEGFNARLTFLHQCTRQGATIGNSDMNAKTAYNLAFGRPPICVLRVGDFYYTKIIINSLQLTYDNPQWDLNPEGIGVMPMFAKVSINFTFIGGSDLAGPIARLQNAVSFNYYANTSVYDNRAEVVEYDPEKTGKEIKYKPFNYPDGPGRSTTDGGILEDI